MREIASRLFAASFEIRYVAIYTGEQPVLAQRPDIADPGDAESDRYEELLVNPTLLLLTRQRGEIDCGGLEYVLVRYGNFFQLIHPIPGGTSRSRLSRAQTRCPSLPSSVAYWRTRHCSRGDEEGERSRPHRVAASCGAGPRSSLTTVQ